MGGVGSPAYLPYKFRQMNGQMSKILSFRDVNVFGYLSLSLSVLAKKFACFLGFCSRGGL